MMIHAPDDLGASGPHNPAQASIPATRTVALRSARIL
jgi:hypothetical protein